MSPVETSPQQDMSQVKAEGLYDNGKCPHSSRGLLTPAEAYDTANQHLKAAA
jgi:hypothetical protein